MACLLNLRCPQGCPQQRLPWNLGSTHCLLRPAASRTRSPKLPADAPASSVTSSRPRQHNTRSRDGRYGIVSSAYPSPSTTSVAVSQYFGRGPYGSTQLQPLKFIVANGNSGPLDCTLKVFVPQGTWQQQQQAPPQRWPLVVLSAGFLLHSGLYGSYASDLASWGLAVALYDLPEVVDDMLMVSTLGSILDTCTRDPRVSPHVDPSAILLAGHSRGGKLSVLTAASDPRVKGLALLDPVDVSGMTPMGPGYPSALPAMRVACGPPRRVPALVLGAVRNANVIPADANYRRFVSSCPGPCWSLELQGAGHLQFLDARVELLSMFVESGPVADETVRTASKAAILAWALELAVPLAHGEAVSGTQVVQRLQQVAEAIQRQTPVASALKGFELLGGPAGSVGAGPSGAGAASAPGGSAREDAGGRGASSSGSSRTSEGSGASSARGGGGAGPDPVDASAARAQASSSSSAAGGGTGSVGGQPQNGGSGKCSYETLMDMRARELKAILVERGVDCADCFEKADLARRIVERC